MEAPLLANLALGPAGSGVYFHRHDGALNVLLHGAKRWLLYPALPAATAGRFDRAAYALAEPFLRPAWGSAAELAETVLAGPEGARQGFAPLSCTQRAHDLMFVPGLWHHATLNLGESVAVAFRERAIQSPLATAASMWADRVVAGEHVRLPAGAGGVPVELTFS